MCQRMMEPSGRTAVEGHSNSSRIWTICGRDVPRGEVVFFSQTIVLYIVIIACLVNLSLGNGDQSLFICLISSCLGYILPNPTLSTKQLEPKTELKPPINTNDDFDGHRNVRHP